VIRKYVFYGAKVGAIAGAISSCIFTLTCLILFLAVGMPSLAGVSLLDFLAGLGLLLGYSLMPIGIAVVIGSFTGGVFGFVLGKFRPAKMNYVKICIAICFLVCIVICALFVLSSLGTFLDPLAMSDGHVVMSLQLTAIVYLVLCIIYIFVGFLVSQYLYNHLQPKTDALSPAP
jgi:hypothetical protein